MGDLLGRTDRRRLYAPTGLVVRKLPAPQPSGSVRGLPRASLWDAPLGTLFFCVACRMLPVSLAGVIPGIGRAGESAAATPDPPMPGPKRLQSGSRLVLRVSVPYPIFAYTVGMHFVVDAAPPGAVFGRRRPMVRYTAVRKWAHGFAARNYF